MPLEQRKGKGKAKEGERGDVDAAVENPLDNAAPTASSPATAATTDKGVENGVRGASPPDKKSAGPAAETASSPAAAEEPMAQRKGLGIPGCLVVCVFVVTTAAWFIGPFMSATFVLPHAVQAHSASGFRLPISDGRGRIRAFVKSSGPRNGDAVLLLHGLASSSFAFIQAQEALSTAGFYVVRLLALGFDARPVL